MKNNYGDQDRKLIATKAITLSRVSSKEQEEGYSIDAQTHRLENYCIRHKLQILQSYEIVESSTNGDRRQFMAMIEFVKSQKETIAIVADKVDRVQRSFKEYPMLDGLIQQGKIELHFNTENYVIHKDSMSQERLMWSMGVIMAQAYVDSLKDNIKRSIEQKIRQGEYISKAPIGYLNIREGTRAKIITDPDRALLIRRLFEEYATGTFTLKEMTIKAKSWGLRNSVGKKDFLGKSQIHKTLNNPFYYGNMQIKGKLYEHIYTPIISRELFLQCEAATKAKNKKPFKWAGNEFLFRGILSCQISGRVVTADKKIKKLASGKQAEWTYLRCWNPTQPEKYMYVREEIVLKQIDDILKNLVIPDETLELINALVKQTDQAERTFLKRHMGELQREQTILQGRLDTLMDLLLDGAIDRNDFDQKKLKLRDKQKDIEAKMSAHRESDDKFKDALLTLLGAVTNAHSIFNSSTSTIAQKRQLINFLFSNLSLKGTNLCFELRKPFDGFLKCTTSDEWCHMVDNLRTNIEMRNKINSLIIPIEIRAFG